MKERREKSRGKRRGSCSGGWAASAKWQKGPGCIDGGPSAAASILAPSSSHVAASFRTPLLRARQQRQVLSGNNIIQLASFSWKRSENLKVHAT
ncbi:hypothetical protein ACQJBY_026259 [Aegilops geniculata]